MGYDADFEGWENLTTEDLLVAYRKAKADCFFENTFPTAIKFAEYEQDLLANLKQFASLLESAALDIHAYTILVNNRKYGDSRVRSPAKETFLRDIARLRGGDNDFVVAATLDVGALRAFQSRAKRWPEKGDKFKPVPEGFKLFGDRKNYPPRNSDIPEHDGMTESD